MEKTVYQRAKALIVQALDLPTTERESFVVNECGSDHRLRTEVLSLLAQHASPADIVESGVLSIDVNDVIEDRWIGQSVGAWTIEERIGTGGMAAVFRARRADESFDQTVAVKVMAAQLVSPSAISRFRAERQILADLDHPFIAKLVDGGTTSENLPYLVMELISGPPLDVYCDNQRIDLAGRLELFRNVCQAVHHAHRNLVVHRDLKPSNILVGSNGDPKLLDFGIAKFLPGNATPGSPTDTQTGFQVMTPEYASPEQVLGNPISISTDIYALGVILFRLLTGRSPYGKARSDLQQLREAIIEGKVKRASDMVASTMYSIEPDTADGHEALAIYRSTTLDRLRRSLRGDLDLIIAKCLQIEPDRRYGTALELSDDIGRYLQNRPIVARGDEWTYRFSKFVRRNYRELIVGFAALALIVGLSVVYAANLARERDLARREAGKSSAVVRFISSIFERADPASSPNRDVTVREVLDRGAERIDGELAGQHEVQAALLKVIGRVYVDIGMYEAGLQSLMKGLDLLEQGVHAPADLADAHYMVANALWRRKRYENSEIHIRKSIGLLESLPNADVSALAQSLHQLGIILRETVRYQEADEALRRADALYASANDPDRAVTLRSLGLLMQERDQLDDAERFFRASLASERKAHGDAHADVAEALSLLSQLLKIRTRYDEALKSYEELLRVGVAAFGDRPHPYIAETLSELGELNRMMGNYAEAERRQVKALAMRTELGELGPFEMARSQLMLGRLVHDQGRLVDAERYYRESLRLHREAVGPEHAKGPIHLNSMSWVLYDQGKHEAAERWARESVALAEKLRGKDTKDVAYGRMHLGRALHRQGKLREAESEMEEALRIGLIVFKEEVVFTSSARRILAEILVDMGEVEAAEVHATKALATVKAISGAKSERLAGIWAVMGRIENARGNTKRARELLQAAIDDQTKVHSADHPFVKRWQRWLDSVPAEPSELRQKRR